MILGKSYLGSTEISKMYLGSTLVYDNTEIEVGLTPIMTNFRVEDATPTLVHFDTPLGSVVGIDHNDFTISGNTINAVDTTNNFFTLASALTFYDNNTIKKVANNSTGCHDFTLEYIENNIAEPTRSNIKWVAVTASGSGDGSSEANAMSKGTFTASIANDTEFRLKAGDYGDAVVVISGYTGVSIIGYRNAFGDVSPTYNYDNFSYTNVADANSIFDSTEMPYFNNGRNDSYSFATNNGSDIIIKNIQQENAIDYGFSNWNGIDHVYYENCVSANNYLNVVDNGSIGFMVQKGGGASGIKGVRFRYCVGFDNNGSNFNIEGEAGFHAAIQCKGYTGRTEIDGGLRASDYHFIMYVGGNNIIKDCIASNPYQTDKSTHAIGIKEQGIECLIVGNTIQGSVGEGYLLAHKDTYGNVLKRNTHILGTDGTYAAALVSIRDGANNNIIENNDFSVGGWNNFSLWKSSEDPNHVDGVRVHPTLAAFSNIIRNNIVGSSGALGMTNSKDPDRAGEYYGVEDNEFYNNTYIFTGSTDDNVIHYQSASNGELTFSNNVFHSNIFECGDNPNARIRRTWATASDIIYNYNDFSNCPFATPSGTGNLSLDAQLDVNNVPQNANLIAAPTLTPYDNSGDERNGTTTTMGGEIHANEAISEDITSPTLNSITVENASPSDVVMVFSESVTMTNLGFTLSGTTSTTFSSISGSGTTWTGVLGTAVENGETITLSYNSTVGDVVDGSDNPLATISSQSVTNNVEVESTGNTYVFDASADSYMTTDLNLNGYNDNTFVVRAKITDGSTERSFLGDVDGSSLWMRYREDPLFDGRYAAGGSSSAGGVTWANDGQYHQFAMTWDSATTTIKLFIDGVEVYTEVDTGHAGWSTDTFVKIGARFTTNTEAFVGEMTDLQFYSRALSATELSDLNSDITNTATNLVANFASNKASSFWVDDENGFEATNEGGVTLT